MRQSPLRPRLPTAAVGGVQPIPLRDLTGDLLHAPCPRPLPGNPGSEEHWWDLCAGPHVNATGDIAPDALDLESVAGGAATLGPYQLGAVPWNTSWEQQRLGNVSVLISGSVLLVLQGRTGGAMRRDQCCSASTARHGRQRSRCARPSGRAPSHVQDCQAANTHVLPLSTLLAPAGCVSPVQRGGSAARPPAPRAGA